MKEVEKHTNGDGEEKKTDEAHLRKKTSLLYLSDLFLYIKLS